MRKIVGSLLLVLAMSCTSAFAATITVDGVIDWGAYCIITDAVDDNGTAGIDLLRYGFAVDRTTGASTHGTLYAFYEISDAVSNWATGNAIFFAGTFIDVDMSTTTEFDPANWWGQPGTNAKAAGEINCEWGEGTWGPGPTVGEGYNYWGSNGNFWNIGNAIAGGQSGRAYSGNVVEMAVDLQQLNNEVLAYTGTYPKAAWWIGGRIAGNNDAATAEGTGYHGDLVKGGKDVGGAPGDGEMITVGDPTAAALAGTPIYIGDYNYDGVVNAADVDFSARGVNGGIENALLDLTGTGTVEDADLTTLLQSGAIGSSASNAFDGQNTWRGDANLDGQVNSTDALALGSNWQTGSGMGWATGDFNGDGAVNSTDALALGANWQNGVGPGVVPEPATLSVLALAGLALLRRRR